MTKTRPLTAGQPHAARRDDVADRASQATATVSAKAEIVSTTTQASTTITSDLANKLPIARTIALGGRRSPRASTTITGLGQRAHHDLRRADVRQPLHGGRRRHHRQHPRARRTTSSSRTRSRRRRPRSNGDLGRVRPLPGRRHQHGHEVRRQRVLGLVPHDVHERRLVRDHARERDARPGRPPSATRRRSAARSGRTTSGSSALRAGSTRARRRSDHDAPFTDIPYPHGDDEKRYQGKLTLTPVREPHAHGLVPEDRQDRERTTSIPTAARPRPRRAS